MSAGFCNSPSGLFHQFIQMSGTRMAVAKRTFNKNLRLSQIFYFPSGTDPERIQLRRQLSHFLTGQHIDISFFMMYKISFGSRSILWLLYSKCRML